jgi:hypothetical protein
LLASAALSPYGSNLIDRVAHIEVKRRTVVRFSGPDPARSRAVASNQRALNLLVLGNA